MSKGYGTIHGDAASAVTLFMLGKYEECLSCVEKALEDITNFHNRNNQWLNFRKAQCYFGLRDLENAEKTIAEILNSKFEHWCFYEQMFDIAVEKNNSDDAIRYGAICSLTDREHKLAELVFILDESGSMANVRSDTIGGFNATIEEHQGKDEKIITSVILFSNTYTKLFDRVPIDEVPKMTEAMYKPHGCTALCDAVGETITDIMSRQNAMPGETRPEKTMVFITTDGLENASKIFTAEAVRKLISNAQENSGWKFVFYGADFDVVETAKQYGIDQADAVRFRKDVDGMRELRVSRSKKLKDFLS